jgi:hypothetical protein
MGDMAITDKTLSVKTANVVAAVLMLPAFLLILLPFYTIWGRLILPTYNSIGDVLLLFVLFFLSVIVHEGLGYQRKAGQN